MKPSVVVIAYDRPAALKRLLDSLARAWHPDGVTLIVSIDRAAGGVNREVAMLANRFEWTHGDKRVILREEHLGVVGHFRECGRLAAEYGAAVLLEDDL